MATEEPTPEHLLRPIGDVSKKYLALAAVLHIPILIFFAGWAIQLAEGMEVTGLSDWGSGGGVPWGVYIGTFVWWVGIAHGGIIISAAVRLINLDKYEPVARIAELLTIGALSMSGLYILIHLGRPDRVVTSIIPAYATTVNTSPLAWDVTVITLYFVLTATYLALTLRSDIYHLRDRLPDILDPVYSALTYKYDPEEDEVVERMVWWIALAIIVLAPLLLHGGVIPWLFSLLASSPTWFGGLTAPIFLSAALTSAMGGVIIVAYAFRRVYDWEAILPDEVFKGLGSWLGAFALLYTWFQLQRILTGIYLSSLDLRQITASTLTNPIYILSMLLIIGSLAFVAFQTVGTIDFSMRGTLAAAFAVVVAVELEKTLFVVEGMEYAFTSLYEGMPGHYMPSWIELSSIIATTALVILFFMGISRAIPVVELKAVQEGAEGGEE